MFNMLKFLMVMLTINISLAMSMPLPGKGAGNNEEAGTSRGAGKANGNGVIPNTAMSDSPTDPKPSTSAQANGKGAVENAKSDLYKATKSSTASSYLTKRFGADMPKEGAVRTTIRALLDRLPKVSNDSPPAPKKHASSPLVPKKSQQAASQTSQRRNKYFEGMLRSVSNPTF